MNNPQLNHRPMIRCRGLALLCAVNLAWWSTPALAADIEIFISTDDQAISCDAPNVLFIIDTSGSMDSEVDTQGPWDPAQTYSGCFDSSRIYYSESGITPYCGFSTTVAKVDVRCQAAASSTEYTGLFQAWNPDAHAWEKIPDSDEDRLIECAADEGIHGDGSNDEVYAVDGTDNPWSAEAANRIAWGTNATSATLFDGNWLNWQTNAPVFTRTRLDVVKEVVSNTIDNMADVNVGLMRFNTRDGGSVVAAIEDLDESREDLQDAIENLEPDGQTPLSETLYEAGQYLAGRLVDFGDADSDAENRSVAASRIGNTLSSNQYFSPLSANGQNNYIVLLTDGEPSADTEARDNITTLPDYGQVVGNSCDGQIDGDCLDEMAQYLYLGDLRSDLPGRQNVITHTIGFAADFQLLQDTATRGGGKYFVVDDVATLTRALADLAKDFSRTASLLTSPTIPVNNFNRSELLNDVYLSLFQPAATAHWPGNLKKYRIIEADNGIELVGADGLPVLTPNGDFIDPSAVSLWSAPLNDGATVPLGGAASRLLNPGTRNLLTNASGDLSLSQLDTGNASVTAAMLSAPPAERDTVIAWARGIDVRDADGDGDRSDPRQSMGDPLHVQPVTGEYGDDENSRNTVIFVATNDGYLHAIDATYGNEIWAFIPQRLLKRLYSLSIDDAAPIKQYGLDGQLVQIMQANGKPDSLLFGMRRGGEALFSMDVSNPTSPSLQWIIDSSQPDFLDMGQSWSPPVIEEIDIGGQIHTVAIIGGGYDPGQDNRDHRLDTKGNAIYFVDVETGDLLWSAGGSRSARSDHDLSLPDMNYSIPAGIRVIDQNQDGLADRMYVGDMGGQLWRFDIIAGNNRSSLVEGGVMASLGAAALTTPPPAQDIRRFYNTPDVVNVIGDRNNFLAINLGSGYRAHPLDVGVDDEFFSVRDYFPAQVISTNNYNSPIFPLVTRADLLDITDDAIQTLERSDAGWRLGMVQHAGEKILGESLTVNNVLFFNSFSPNESTQSCLPGGGLNRNYRVDVVDGSALTNLDNSPDPDNLTPTDRFAIGSEGAPVAGPIRDPDGSGVCSGIGCFSDDNPIDAANEEEWDSVTVNPTYWYPVEAP